MAAIRKSFRGMAIAAAAAGALAVPSTAAAQGVDPTRFCMQDGVNTYLYNPYSVKTARQLVTDLADCSLGFVRHVTSDETQHEYRKCLLAGIAQSTFPHEPTPFLVALDYCTAAWLEYQIQVDPYPE